MRETLLAILALSISFAIVLFGTCGSIAILRIAFEKKEKKWISTKMRRPDPLDDVLLYSRYTRQVRVGCYNEKDDKYIILGGAEWDDEDGLEWRPIPGRWE